MSTITSEFRKKDGSPYILGHHAKLYRRQDFKMCDNFVSFVQGRAFYMGEQHVQSLQSGSCRTCVLKSYLLFEHADFQASSRDEGLEIRTFSQPL